MGDWTQGRNEARWRPGQEASLAPPCSNLRSFGSKSIYFIEETTCDIVGTFRHPPAAIRRLGNCVPSPPLVTPPGHAANADPCPSPASYGVKSLSAVNKTSIAI